MMCARINLWWSDHRSTPFARCLYSIGDNFSFLNSNRKPIDTMIEYLKMYFHAGKFDEGFGLAISGGVDGARLTHSHARHYHYVLQSLTLWREINDDMVRGFRISSFWACIPEMHQRYFKSSNPVMSP